MTDTATTSPAIDDRRTPARWWALPAAIAVVAIGVWVTGGVLTNNETVAMGLTGVWLLLAGVVAVFVAWRQRALAAPVLIGYAIAAVGIGGFLGYTSMVDQVVDEDVVVATSDSTDPSSGGDGAGASGAGDSGSAENQLLAEGTFVAEAHPTEGSASVIETADGVVVTLTDFVTDPGPDLKVYLVPKGADVEDGVNLGSLKGNKGNQQYDVPASFDTSSLAGGSVVIWCRAFTVSFGSSALS
ncbi:MAG TPA: DM13 domain-containing protein [Actinomycetes bacterium]|nr:DM13 domain-containing protein [Actinomycetes bacterium]